MEIYSSLYKEDRTPKLWHGAMMMTLSEHEKVLLATKAFVCKVPFYTRSYVDLYSPVAKGVFVK